MPGNRGMLLTYKRRQSNWKLDYTILDDSGILLQHRGGGRKFINLFCWLKAASQLKCAKNYTGMGIFLKITPSSNGEVVQIAIHLRNCEQLVPN